MFLTLTLRDMMYQSNDTLFDDITLDSRLTKEILVRQILHEADERPTVSAYWQYQKVLINDWFITHAKTISDLIDTTEYEYNPIHNYDRHEEYEDTIKSNGIKVSNVTNDYNASVKNTSQSTDSGTDKVAQSGTDKVAQSGTDTTKYGKVNTEQHTGTDKNAKTGNDDIAHTGTITTKTNATTDNTSNTTNNSTKTGQLSGYNSADYVNHDKEVDNTTGQTTSKDVGNSDQTVTHANNDKTTYNSTDTRTANLTDTSTLSGSDGITYGKTDTTTYGKVDTTTYGKQVNETDNSTSSGGDTSRADSSNVDTTTTSHKAHLYGNIGVTTTQQMIEAQRDVVLFNIYNTITNMFCNDMLLGIWT